MRPGLPLEVGGSIHPGHVADALELHRVTWQSRRHRLRIVVLLGYH
jgi:hypothetical protein